MKLADYIKNVLRSRYVLFSLVKWDIKSKYRRSILGVAWSVLTPLGLVLIVGSVYSILWGQDPAVLIPRLFTGLTPWIFITTSAEAGANCFVVAEGYIKQTMTNIEIFPLRVASVAFINLLYSMGAFLLVYLFIAPQNYSFSMLMVLPGLMILYMFGAGAAMISGLINLHLRDFQPFQSLVLQGFFYATPIIYPAEMLEQKGYSFIYECNPLYYMIEVVRTPLTGSGIPSGKTYIIATIISCVVFLVGVYKIEKIGRKIVFKL